MKYPMLEQVLAASGQIFLVCFKSKYGTDISVCSTEQKANDLKAQLEASQEYKHSEEYDETYVSIKAVRVDDSHSHANIR